MLIREVTAADSSSYFELRVQSEQEFPQFVGFNVERELAAGQSGIDDLLAGYASEGTVVWGAFEQSQLIGVLAFSRRLSLNVRLNEDLSCTLITSASSQDQQRLYRFDKFGMPHSARSEFLENVRHTHEFLRTRPGFIQDSVFEQTSGPGVFN